jgi:DNA-binding SARP family transcriptional activator
MIPSLTKNTTYTHLKSPEPLLQTRLPEATTDLSEQAQLAEILALFSSASQRDMVGPSYVATLLDLLNQDHDQYLYIQQKIRELFALSTEIALSLATLTTLQASPYRPSQEDNKHAEVGDFQAQYSPEEQASASPTLYAICFGPFAVYQQGVSTKLCTNRNSQTTLRFLIAQPDHCASADTLMDLLWPEDPADVALRKLHVTVSILRSCLRAGCSPHHNAILYQHGIYQLNPAIILHSDVEEFLALYHAGQKAGGETAIPYFERACALYKRPFLLEDLYADWSFTRREQLRQIHLKMSSVLSSHYLMKHRYDTAMHWALEMIKENPCDESAHRQLMRIYALQGRRNDALRQYQRFRHMLKQELNLLPMPETEALYQAILHGNIEAVNSSEI